MGMKNKFLIKTTCFILLIISTISCVDPYHLESTNFEEAIVIEATITNELKKHEVKLSKTYRFEDNGPTFQSGASVYVSDDMGNTYDFEEDNGKYISVSEFQAMPQRKYQLNITTSDGKSYISNEEILTTSIPISDVNAIVTTKEGQRGVQLNVNSFDPTATSKYYRYEYEETFKIVSPSWVGINLAYDISTDEFYYTYRNPDLRVCYSTDTSYDIILKSTAEQSEDRVQDFEVRFISDQNYIISHRYSILVKQYVENLFAYNFYATLQKLSSSESILSQTQPGFLSGNIKSTSDENEKVIGFFDVASVSTKRIFFNYSDLFPGENLPPYAIDCTPKTYDILEPPPPFGLSPRDFLILEIENNSSYYFDYQHPLYFMVPPPCADCTTFSSNVIPSFWE